jgi:predicted dehydrogenase
MNGKPRLAIIGTGSISDFHVAAAKAVGFSVDHIAASPKSVTIDTFANKHLISNTWSSPIELAESWDHWDAIVLATTTEALAPLVELAMRSKKPVLTEKPVGVSSKQISHLVENSENVLVGFNRRYYAPIQEAKRFIEMGGPSIVHVELPESVPWSIELGRRDNKQVRLNSVHGFDLVNYLFPHDVNTFSCDRHMLPGSRGGVLVTHSQKGDICTIAANWNAPANFSITIDRDDERFELRPLEYGFRYQGMESVEPTKESPIRKYIPQIIHRYPPDSESIEYKPGFIGQYREFLLMIDDEKPKIGATLHDAKIALQFAEALISG